MPSFRSINGVITSFSIHNLKLSMEGDFPYPSARVFVTIFSRAKGILSYGSRSWVDYWMMMINCGVRARFLRSVGRVWGDFRN